jgi:type IV secretion system protein VirD4
MACKHSFPLRKSYHVSRRGWAVGKSKVGGFRGGLHGAQGAGGFMNSEKIKEPEIFKVLSVFICFWLVRSSFFDVQEYTSRFGWDYWWDIGLQQKLITFVFRVFLLVGAFLFPSQNYDLEHIKLWILRLLKIACFVVSVEFIRWSVLEYLNFNEINLEIFLCIIFVLCSSFFMFLRLPAYGFMEKVFTFVSRFGVGIVLIYFSALCFNKYFGILPGFSGFLDYYYLFNGILFLVCAFVSFFIPWNILFSWLISVPLTVWFFGGVWIAFAVWNHGKDKHITWGMSFIVTGVLLGLILLKVWMYLGCPDFLNDSDCEESAGIFGRARAATLEEIHAAKFNHLAGWYVGEYYEKGEARSVFYGGDRHGTMTAPTRSGKSRTILFRHLTCYEGSAFINDPKGELAMVTAQHRRDVLKQDVFILNPYGLFLDDLPNGINGFRSQGFKMARFNPLASLDLSHSQFSLKLDSLAADLVPLHDSKHSFWVDSARQIVAGYLRFLVETKEPKDRNICDLYWFLTRAQAGGHTFKNELEGMFSNPFSSKKVYAALSCLADTSGKVGEFIGNAKANFSFMADEALRESLTGDDFDFRDFKWRASTLYVILPSHGMRERKMWLQFVFASGITSLSDVSQGRGLDTLFLLDELKTLGHMETLAHNYSAVSGYGVRFWLVFQTMSQLKKLYPDEWHEFMNGAGFNQYFTPGPEDMETANAIAERCGKRTVPNESRSRDGAGGESVSKSRVGVPFWTPQEVLGMPQTRQILFAPGLEYPIILERENYDQSPKCSGLNPNPYVPTDLVERVR